MFGKCLRIGLLVVTLVASLHVAAAPRFWTLTGVQQPGYLVTGYFSYDDVTNTVSNWNVRVDEVWRGHFFPPLTYLAGNSAANSVRLSSGGHGIIFASAFVASDYDANAPPPYSVPLPVMRTLSIYTRAPLDGSSPTVSLDLAQSLESFSVDAIEQPSRRVTAGSLTLTPVPPPVVIAQVDEYFNATLGHYFITADSAEKQALSGGAHAGWTPTGQSFKAYAKGSNTSGSVNPVCRFYSPPEICSYYACEPGSNSHFFTADTGECMIVRDRWWYAWAMEGDNVFQIDLPDKTSGACPAGTIPVYRLVNQRTDSDHRYTTSVAIKAQMIAGGYVAEGYGPDGVVMCAVQ